MSTASPPDDESPHRLRLSLAAAMTLGFKPGIFYRNARLHCINLLLTYADGCHANCAYCGLSGRRRDSWQERSFIRVAWPTHPLDEIETAMAQRRNRIKRICVSMVTQRRAAADTLAVIRRLGQLEIPISVLVAPTVIDAGDLRAFKAAGADRIGVAIDLATEELFDRYRGSQVGGPHRWETYWNCLQTALEIFGAGRAGAHFMVGMGETEAEMCQAMQRTRDMGGLTHLFSFFPESGSLLAHRSPPPMDVYRRIQLARYLIDTDRTRCESFSFDCEDRIDGFRLAPDALERIIDVGEPFRTSGCKGRDGTVACNRPYGNERPGPDLRNYPFAPEPADIARIRGQLGGSISACHLDKQRADQDPLRPGRQVVAHG